MNRIAPCACALVFAVAHLATGAARAQAPASPAAEPLASTARSLALEPPATRIYRSTDASGAVSYGDEPARGARAVEVRTYSGGTDPSSLEAARRQRDYWRAQADNLSRRLDQRAREEARARAEAERLERDRIVLVVPRHLRAPAAAYGVGVPIAVPPPSPGPGAPMSGTYGSSPGAAAGAPAAFIGSGFSTAR